MKKDSIEVRESEFNELAFKIARINKLQDRVNMLWQAPKERWFVEGVASGNPEFGFVLIGLNLISLYSEVRPKCTEEEKKEADAMRDKIGEVIEKGQEAIYDKKLRLDTYIFEYNHDKYMQIKKMLKDFEDFVRQLLDNHGYNPDKNDVRGL